MNRRALLKKTGALLAGTALAPVVRANTAPAENARPVLKLVHITDVHLPENNPEVAGRFKKCLEAVRKHNPDFILNGGDSIMDASYDNVTREKVLDQWAAWDDALKTLGSIPVYSCIGNHDPWWAAKDKTDPLYGKNYVVSRLRVPARYYSFEREGWHFIVLDGNNKGISLDEEQYQWLEQELKQLKPGTPTLLMSHFPVFGATPVLVGGNHSDNKKLKTLFYQHRDKVRVMLSGHNHLYDQTKYNGVLYCCNGAMSGFWWGKGDQDSAGEGYYFETAPGFALLKLYADGKIENEYIPHRY